MELVAIRASDQTLMVRGSAMFELFVGLVGLVVTIMVIVAIFDIRKLLAAILKELRARPPGERP